jgi:formylglycine-generating enzyme
VRASFATADWESPMPTDVEAKLRALQRSIRWHQRTLAGLVCIVAITLLMAAKDNATTRLPGKVEVSGSLTAASVEAGTLSSPMVVVGAGHGPSVRINEKELRLEGGAELNIENGAAHIHGPLTCGPRFRVRDALADVTLLAIGPGASGQSPSIRMASADGIRDLVIAGDGLLVAPLIQGWKGGQMRDDNEAHIKLLWCPPGAFQMGSPTKEKYHQASETQAHVSLSRGFWMSQFTVTQAQWKRVMGTTPWHAQIYTRDGDDYPATYVTQGDAMRFCERLTAIERVQHRLSTTMRFRVPTEAEWEYACRAGTTTAYSFGQNETDLDKYAWFVQNTAVTKEKYAHRVGQKLPNALGFYDMHGNVWEWCLDGKADTLPGGVNPIVAPATGEVAVRGQSWHNGGARSATRHWLRADGTWSGLVGFRVVLAIPD